MLVFIGKNTHAQSKILFKIDTPATQVYADNLDNFYLLTPNDELLKYDVKGKLKWQYSNNRYGKLQSVDVSDPLRIVLFYADFQKLVVLNNNLNEIGSYAFANNSNMLVAAIASANNNGYWAFERNNNYLIKLSSNFIEETHTANLYQMIGKVVVPIKLIATDQYIYLLTSDEEILQFDRFGLFNKILPLAAVKDFNISTNKVVYLVKNELFFYDTLTFELNKMPLPTTLAIKQVALGNKIIVALTEKAVFLLSK